MKMSVRNVSVFLLCSIFFVSNIPAKDALIIDQFKHLINETRARIKIVADEQLRLHKDIDYIELKSKSAIHKLKATNGNLSEAVRAATREYIDLYARLNNLKSSEAGLIEFMEPVVHRIKVQKLVIMLLEQDLAVFTERRESGSAQKCQEYEKNLLLTTVQPLVDEITVLTNELRQAKTELKEMLFAKEKLRVKLNATKAAGELEINHLKELIVANKDDEEKAKKTVEKFKTEVKEEEARLKELGDKDIELHEEKNRMEMVLKVLKDDFLKIQGEVSCYQKLERDILKDVF